MGRSPVLVPPVLLERLVKCDHNYLDTMREGYEEGAYDPVTHVFILLIYV